MKLTDADLLRLQGYPQLEWLNLDKTGITDTGLAHLRGMTQLQELYLKDTPITDAGLEYLKKCHTSKNCNLVTPKSPTPG